MRRRRREEEREGRTEKDRRRCGVSEGCGRKGVIEGKRQGEGEEKWGERHGEGRTIGWDRGLGWGNQDGAGGACACLLDPRAPLCACLLDNRASAHMLWSELSRRSELPCITTLP